MRMHIRIRRVFEGDEVLSFADLEFFGRAIFNGFSIDHNICPRLCLEKDIAKLETEKETLTENYLGKKFGFSAFGFFQNNTEVAEMMLKYVHEIFSGYDIKNTQLLDLYGGVGTFGIINADLFENVVIVESYKPSVDMASINVTNNKIDNVSAVCLNAKSMGRIKFNDKLFVITDPPRSGMEQKTIDTLKKLKPEVIIYVSCNAEQLGKDIKKFKEYTIRSAALFDMFPQTRHCETVVELIKIK